MSQRLKNRIISYACLAVFGVALVVAGLTITRIAKEIEYRDRLIAIRDNLIVERDWQEANGNYGDEDYVSVYVKDNYSIYDASDTIYVFVK